MYTSKTNHFFQLVFRVMSLPLELQLFWKLAFPQVRKSTVYFQVYMLSGTQDNTTPPPPGDNFLECPSVYSIVTAFPSLLSLVTARHVTYWTKWS